MMLLILILSLFSVTDFANGEIRITLNSGNFSGVWTVHNDSSSEKIEAHVPGGIYSDLNLTQDLFYRQNDIAYRWVAYENWTYETTFELTDEILNKTAINLVFHGIDTIGDIFLNGQLIQTVNNMFVRYVIPIKDIAQEKNELEVRLKSPVLAAKELADAEGYEIIKECPESQEHGECHRNFLRKMQASFSYSMAPAFPSSGIWKPVEIEAFNTALVRDSVGRVRLENETYIIEAFCYYEGATEDDYEWGNYMLSIWIMQGGVGNETDQKIAINKSVQRSSVQSFKSFIFNDTYELEANGVRPWWPNGYGEQPLYTLQCGFETLNADFENEASIKRVNFGYRSIELVEEEITPGEKGLSYYFKVNEVPIFVKGTNWIPSHILPELGQDENTLRHLLQSVKDANMNMIRVWGGGVYESDLFYNICDELGILVWQDMMFSEDLYPSNEKYLESVAIEIHQQIKRLATHPSVVIWSGNDENEAWISAIKNGGIIPPNATELYVNDYLKLYVETIQPIIERIDNTRPFSLSSPSNGLQSIQEEYIAEDPYSPLYGTRAYMPHGDVRNTTSLANSRFFSKFGYQSMPSFKSISQVSVPDDWNLLSEFSDNRQHDSIGGYGFMNYTMQLFLPLLEDDGSKEFYETYIYYSQILQAFGTKTASETYRVDRNRLKAGNEGMTSGILLWHLNDVWQAPTRSSIEYGGRWKMLHYYAVKFFAPLAVVPQITDNDELEVYVVSDLLEVVTCNLTVSVHSWDNFRPIFSLTLEDEQVANSTSYKAYSVDLPALLDSLGLNKTNCFVHLTLTGRDIFAENFFYPSSFSDVTNLEPAKITVNVWQDIDSNDIFITLGTDRIAPFVWLETDVEGIFSDNGFTLIEETMELKFSNRGAVIDVDKFTETLTVHSLLGGK